MSGARKRALDRGLARLNDPEYFANFIKMRETPIELEPVSGDWVHCREARLIISDVAQCSLADAEQAICRRASHWIPLQVATFARGEEPHDYIDRFEFFEGIEERKLTHFDPAPLPADWSEVRSFFEYIADHVPILSPKGVHYSHWATGDFKVTIERDFSDVTIEITGLHLDRPALFRSLGVASSIKGTISTRSPISDDLVIEWIRACGIENSKIAWQRIKAELGDSSPKKTDQFERIWRELKGNRPRGRPRRSG